MNLIRRYRNLESRVRRTTSVPMMVRLGLFAAGLGALLTALPLEHVNARSVAILFVLALLPAARPGSGLPTTLSVAAIGLYLIATAGYGERITIPRVLALACLLYAVHSLAALAACLPYDVAVRPEAVTGWVIRLLGVLFGSAAVLVLALAAVGRLTLGGYAAFAFGGLVAAVGATWLLARISR
ncbi:hypothetical protein [Catenuloplanes japonicus]|uniref:hypothetical protein n=1 Tax=Catenuloplanes japonicus TaxID=33876 RepID=UPI000690C9C8|nr:hypothetical protein [Catenuloplanes japonicus]